MEAQRSSSGSDYVDTSASDAILDRIPGKEELTSLVAGILNGSEAAVSGLQGLLQGGGDGGSGDNFQKLLVCGCACGWVCTCVCLLFVCLLAAWGFQRSTVNSAYYIQPICFNVMLQESHL